MQHTIVDKSQKEQDEVLSVLVSLGFDASQEKIAWSDILWWIHENTNVVISPEVIQESAECNYMVVVYIDKKMTIKMCETNDVNVGIVDAIISLCYEYSDFIKIKNQ